MKWFIDMLTNRCPVCREGAIFHSLIKMNADCPVCQTHFEREVGFFSMSIFIGYIVATVIALPFFIVALLLRLDIYWLIGLPGAVIILTTPIIFRYGRILWIYIDEWLDPRSVK
ncbi:MAG: DUF983 domain-containing protein [Ardenticatenaceae bacterium]|nr:DUF983 domain-containing protein [Ardenticatenaceae bacterium]